MIDCWMKKERACFECGRGQRKGKKREEKEAHGSVTCKGEMGKWESGVSANYIRKVKYLTLAVTTLPI